MKGHRESGDPQELVKDYRERQQNLVWPGPLINGARIDRFLWNGSPSPTLVQRLASRLIGSVLFVGGLMLLALAFRERASLASVLVLITLACAYAYADIRVFLNGFAKCVRGPVLAHSKNRHRP